MHGVAMAGDAGHDRAYRRIARDLAGRAAALDVESISAAWARSGHADYSSISFTYWDEREPPLIPAGCAMSVSYTHLTLPTKA
jgi:hypothetical protein